MSRHAPAMEKLDSIGLDEICDRLVDGDSYTGLAREYGVSVASFSNWVALDVERSTRAQEASRLGATAIVESINEDLKAASNAFELAKAEKIGYNKRWVASKMDSRKFGDKLQIDQKTTVINLSTEEIQRREAELDAQIAKLKAGSSVTPIEAPADDEPAGP